MFVINRYLEQIVSWYNRAFFEWFRERKNPFHPEQAYCTQRQLCTACIMVVFLTHHQKGFL